MSNDLDILSIDVNIKKNFDDEVNKISLYEEKLKNIEDALQNDNTIRKIRNKILNCKEELINYIEDLKIKKSKNFYLIETIEYIERYKEILKTPIKINFMGVKNTKNKEKQEIIDKYIEIARKYVDIDVDEVIYDSKIVCTNCGQKKDFEIIDNMVYVCLQCYAKQYVMKHNSSYNDIDRVNISTKYMYDPKIHFRDCIKQYQGKQNCTIPQKVYDDLEVQFERHFILEGKKGDDKSIRFRKLTKNHIMIFLKELNYPKHYENVHLIHYNFTGIKPDDILYLEDKLLDDFDLLIDLYHKTFKHIKRKNFINTQYVLYQLLCHHRHPCKKEEFIILKTVDRKIFHDEICKTLFETLGWNMVSFY